MQKLRAEKGITLIALVITIIVMLILVGVSVTVALNGGLFTTAKEAAEGTASKRNEELELSSGKVEINGEWYNSIDEYVNGAEGTENESGNEETALAAGTYDANGNLLQTWDALDINLEENVNPGINTTVGKLHADATKLVISNDVTKIGEYQFQSVNASHSLAEIVLPNSIISIGQNAFRSCSKLTNIIIPDSVISIGSGAFFNCGFTSITIPDSIITIESNVFDTCQNLTTITLPNSIEEIKTCAFSSCTSLTEINYNGTQEQWNNIQLHFQSEDGGGSDWNWWCPEITVHCTDGDIIIPANGS